jgi:hypothetical protein
MKALLAILALTLAARTAQAQAVLHDDPGAFRSPQNWAIELRFGPYIPEIDSELKGADSPPYQTYFGKKHHLMSQLEVDYQFFHLFGSAAVAGQVGYLTASAKARNAAGHETGDKTNLLLVPTAVQLVYRMDEAARRWSIPLVPYAKLGLSYTFWRIGDGNGNVAKSEDGGHGSGGTPGWQAAVGVALQLDLLDPGSARSLDSETGVNHSYLFFEYAHYEASGLGRKNVLHVGDTTWVLGLMFEL